ncbi:phosphodiesterase [bacterium BMS3Bbin14]|nr:phosphodiesterase [bacterium BMS3Abin13]GBE53293.1 phosphodiesterase [bacterium BMS3Bbin14]HDK43745.1 metallophosphoesterase [Desulfobacteraceae bacterium]HDL98937.1 metallophosphoesterase [Desulfobacteraceae bacterium]HDO29447.1 metallophosphoesterase [Desulfobacteraceae bacterium]
MKKVAFISDIHGNLEAFQAVLADIDRLAIHTIFCLGDCVGYGPEPEQVITEIRNRAIPTVMGNHELALINDRYYNSFNFIARQSLDITRTLISPATWQYISAMPATMLYRDARMVHGCPPASITRYLFTAQEYLLKKIFSEFAETLCFFGHTHTLALYTIDQSDNIHGQRLERGTYGLEPRCRHLINAGSVGQPRDGNNNAKYVIWDEEEKTIEIRYIPYDIQSTFDKIIAAGLPTLNATRLL